MSSLRAFLITAGTVVAAILLIKLITFGVLMVLTTLLIGLGFALGFGLLYSMYIFVRSALSRHVVH